MSDYASCPIQFNSSFIDTGWKAENVVAQYVINLHQPAPPRPASGFAYALTPPLEEYFKPVILTVNLTSPQPYLAPIIPYHRYIESYKRDDVNYDLLVGPARSACSVPIATLAGIDKIPQVGSVRVCVFHSYPRPHAHAHAHPRPHPHPPLRSLTGRRPPRLRTSRPTHTSRAQSLRIATCPTPWHSSCTISSTTSWASFI